MSGYCADAVRTISAIGTGPETKAARMAFMHSHIHGCDQCQRANKAKEIEAMVAKELVKRGHTTALMHFASGRPSPVDYMSDEYKDALTSVLKKENITDEKFLAFVLQLVNERSAWKETQ